jgi:hypothetical protein
MYKIITGDATNPVLGPMEIAIIPHVCNNLGGWGAGFVLALTKEFGILPKEAYLKQTNLFPNKLDRLGKVSFAKMKERRVIIANMIAQNGYISGTNPRPLKYDALVQCMKIVTQQIEYLNNNVSSFSPEYNFTIHTCKFGSDLAGGNWSFIECLIEDIWTNSGIDVTVYEFEEK